MTMPSPSSVPPPASSSSSRQQDEDGEVKVLDESHIAACSKVMAHAFCDSPAYKYMFQDMTTRERTEFLEWLFEKNLRLTMSKCPTALRGILDDNDEGVIICCFLWTPAPHHDHSTWEIIQAGLWQLPYQCGSWTALKRLLAVIDTAEQDATQIFKTPNNNTDTDNVTDTDCFVQLERMAVRPDWQGTGIGTRALQRTLREHFSVAGKATPVRLSTQEERNVRFYRDRLGFEVVLENTKFEEDAEFGYRNWAMVKTTTN
jgi:GNAT superfamily N-acetyltransferase